MPGKFGGQHNATTRLIVISISLSYTAQKNIGQDESVPDQRIRPPEQDISVSYPSGSAKISSTDVEVPKPNKKEVLVDVHAAGLNFFE